LSLTFVKVVENDYSIPKTLLVSLEAKQNVNSSMMKK
jgi:hypothetical protein